MGRTPAEALRDCRAVKEERLMLAYREYKAIQEQSRANVLKARAETNEALRELDDGLYDDLPQQELAEALLADFSIEAELLN